MTKTQQRFGFLILFSCLAVGAPAHASEVLLVRPFSPLEAPVHVVGELETPELSAAPIRGGSTPGGSVPLSLPGMGSARWTSENFGPLFANIRVPGASPSDLLTGSVLTFPEAVSSPEGTSPSSTDGAGSLGAGSNTAASSAFFSGVLSGTVPPGGSAQIVISGTLSTTPLPGAIWEFITGCLVLGGGWFYSSILGTTAFDPRRRNPL